MGFPFPSISLYKKTITASGGGVGSFARRPSITPTFSETILSNLKFKIKKKETVTKIKSQKLWALISIRSIKLYRADSFVLR